MTNPRAVKLITRMILDPRTDMRHFGRNVVTHAYEVRAWLAEKPMVDLDKCKDVHARQLAQRKIDMLVQAERSINYKYQHYWQYANATTVSQLEFEEVVRGFYHITQHLMADDTFYAMLQHIRSQDLLNAIHARADLVPAETCHPDIMAAFEKFAREPAHLWPKHSPYENRARAVVTVDELPWFKQTVRPKESPKSGGMRRGQIAMAAMATLGAGHLSLK